ncbi:FAD-binding domain-containing protein [Polyplosphaeria fusca]|uniref:Delta(24)-sterol reductase n=1 Tax=Polyplosphaeria fusca TaxID=682080 RepID=A0A9P4QJF0_9PLEO|nr:FAD-binding domain-containing protein [Polyplosphaeria fusca]
MEEHNRAVSVISDKVASFHASKTPFRIYHGSTLSTRPSPRTKTNTVDISSLDHVLSIDTASKLALVEPNVPMDALVKATKAHGLLPPVVMELPNITVGGGFAGTSGESSSFRHGTFDCTVRSIEVVLGNGTVVTARSSDPDTKDLLYGCAGGCGTLGIITLLELELVDYRPFVELTIYSIGHVDEGIKLMREAERTPAVAYIDGIMYSRSSGVLMVGKLVEEKPSEKHLRTFHRATDPWFFLFAEDIMRSLEMSPADSLGSGHPCHTEYIPTEDYLFRYDRAVFWSGKLAFNYFWFPFNAATRWLLDPLMKTRVVNHALHRSGLASQAIIQDLGLPYSTSREFIDYISDTLNFWPLWLCPVKSPHALGRASFSMDRNQADFPDIMLDVGVWGMGPGDQLQFIRLNRDIEKVVKDLGGIKCLYAHAYYTEDEFWDIYNEKKYKDLRRKWHAESLPSVYDKVKVDLRGVDAKEGKAIDLTAWAKGNLLERIRGRVWGVYGVLSALKGMLFGSDFLLKK